MVLSNAIIEKYNKKVIKNDDVCWDWNGAKDKDGYGTLWDNVNQKTYKAHRISFIIFNLNNESDIPSNMEICHSCDNPTCSNPNHLFISSHKGNMIDAASKDRFENRDGELNGNAILTNDIIHDFINSAIHCEITSDTYLEKFPNITKSMYWKIFRKEQWKTVSNMFDEHDFINGKYYFYYKYTFDRLNALKEFIKHHQTMKIKDILSNFSEFNKDKIMKVRKMVLNEMV